LRKAEGEIKELKTQIHGLKEEIEKLRQNIEKTTGPTVPPEPPVIPDGGNGTDGPTAPPEPPVVTDGGDGTDGPTVPPEPPVIPDGGDGTDGPTAPPEPPGGDDEYVDLPIIDGKTGIVKRSILRVVDIEHEPPITIDSDEFFKEKLEYIERVARMLDEARATGRKAYLCECCGNPVKIAKRDYGFREVLFFSHCRRGIKCDWKQEQSIIKTPPPIGGDLGGEPPIAGKPKRKIVKEFSFIKNSCFKS